MYRFASTVHRFWNRMMDYGLLGRGSTGYLVVIDLELPMLPYLVKRVGNIGEDYHFSERYESACKNARALADAHLVDLSVRASSELMSTSSACTFGAIAAGRFAISCSMGHEGPHNEALMLVLAKELQILTYSEVAELAEHLGNEVFLKFAKIAAYGK